VSDVAQLPPAKTSRVVEIKQAEAAPPAKTGRGGRPRLGEEGKTLRARKPWLDEGMSERTLYRRKKDGQ